MFLSLFQICDVVSETTLACPSPKIDLASNMTRRTRRQTNEDDVLDKCLISDVSRHSTKREEQDILSEEPVYI